MRADVDVVVVGAGFAGLCLLHRLRKMGLSVRGIEAAADVGGTWYWNRYPGARCDIQSLDYSLSFDPAVDGGWQWSEKFATQPEILRYAQHVADTFDLRRDILFSTRVVAAAWDDGASMWNLTTDRAGTIGCRFYIMASGCLSVPKVADIEGIDQFTGETYYTGRWPHDAVDFRGKRVGVVGTGSSAIQSIPIIASQAASLTVFQRTPNFSIPAGNGPIPEDKRAAIEGDRRAYRERARQSVAGVPLPRSTVSALQVTAEERNAKFEAEWTKGGIIELLNTFSDILLHPAANETLAEFIRNKIRSVVDDPEIAATLCPTDYPVGTKRLCVDTGYYQTFNLPHVRLVDLRRHPIARITAHGIDLQDESVPLDVIVCATGFDAMTGPVVAVDIRGRHGLSLREKWADGPRTYLGLAVAGIPNFFTVTGPGSPSVLSNMMVTIEQHVEWIAGCLAHMQRNGLDVVEPTELAERGWVDHVNDFASITLFPKAKSWYMGANVPGKPRAFLPYVGGVGTYQEVCDEVAANSYLGFRFEGTVGTLVNDGVVRRVQPDVAMLLAFVQGLGLPSMDTLPVDAAREMSRQFAAQMPPGPEVGEVRDGRWRGASGELAYRLYRPPTPGPHQVTVYFHGGGWVLGAHDADDAFCRDLCVRTGSLVLSMDYRHAPEHRFPAAADDACAALAWAAGHRAELGGLDTPLVVAGYSAGAGLAAVAVRGARDTGGPSVGGQLLLTPVTDSDFTRGSYTENADGFILTRALMQWFWNHYIDETDRADPRVSPIRAASLAGLPPAVIVTAEFDPLRDEGEAYAAALQAAGVPVTLVRARGHIHTSLINVNGLPSGAPVRAAMVDAARELFGESRPVAVVCHAAVEETAGHARQARP